MRQFFNYETCCWYRLRIPVEHSLLPEFQDRMTVANPGPWTHFPEEVFKPEWLSQMYQEYNLTFTLVIAVVRDQGESWELAPVHVDRFDVVGYDAAINWCLGEDQRVMQWYTNMGDGGQRQPSPQFEGIGYQINSSQGLTVRDRVRIGNQPTLVRTDVPHNIEVGPGTRISISARIGPPNITWQEACLQYCHLFDHREDARTWND
jgi:hypothetical protein